MALQQQKDVQGVLALLAGEDDLTDPVRCQVDDAAGAGGQALLAPTREVMDRALVRLVGDADLGHDPPAARACGAGEGAQLGASVALNQAMLRAAHGPADDLAADQFDALVRA